MIKIKTISSGSKGNCYIVDDGNSKVILDAGISSLEIFKGIDFDFEGVSGVLVTHEHIDHVRGLGDLVKMGFDCYASKGTIKKTKIKDSLKQLINEVKPFEDVVVGSWVIIPFDTQHDALEPLGYVLINKKGESLLFATDTYYLKYKFNHISHMLIECNFSREILKKNIDRLIDIDKKNELSKRYERLLKSHMSIETLKEYLRGCETKDLVEVHLIHLSDYNSDSEGFKEEIKKIVGVPVYVAG